VQWLKLVIPATQEVSWFEAGLRQKVCEVLLSVVAYTCHPSYKGNINRRMEVQVNLGINVRPYLKNNQTQKSWD
jgi:hypothetical protein